MAGPAQRLDALHDDRAAARTFDLRAHGAQEAGQVGDFGLARGILQHGLTVRERGRHQQVLGAGDGDRIEHNLRALEALGSCLDEALFDRDLGAHGLQTGNVQVDWPRTDRAAAR